MWGCSRFQALHQWYFSSAYSISFQFKFSSWVSIFFSVQFKFFNSFSFPYSSSSWLFFFVSVQFKFLNYFSFKFQFRFQNVQCKKVLRPICSIFVTDLDKKLYYCIQKFADDKKLFSKQLHAHLVRLWSSYCSGLHLL